MENSNKYKYMNNNIKSINIRAGLSKKETACLKDNLEGNREVANS